jgi:hypothetical protein
MDDRDETGSGCILDPGQHMNACSNERNKWEIDRVTQKKGGVDSYLLCPRVRNVVAKHNVFAVIKPSIRSIHNRRARTVASTGHAESRGRLHARI